MDLWKTSSLDYFLIKSLKLAVVYEKMFEREDKNQIKRHVRNMKNFCDGTSAFWKKTTNLRTCRFLMCF